MKKHIVVACILLILCGCAPSETMIQTAIAALPTRTPYPTYTANPSLTPYPTYTPLPTYTARPTLKPVIKIVTATNSPTPLNTATPTPTWAPFNVTNCVAFTYPSDPAATKKEFDEKLSALVGKCVRFYYDGENYVLGTDMVYMSRVRITNDDATPPDAGKPDKFGIVWGILDNPSAENMPWRLYLRKWQPYLDNQQPLKIARLYSVGIESEMYPGLWKSGQPTTGTSSCYWARINPANGDILSNHFGIGGITTRVREGEIFETDDDCGNWYYVGQ